MFEVLIVLPSRLVIGVANDKLGALAKHRMTIEAAIELERSADFIGISRAPAGDEDIVAGAVRLHHQASWHVGDAGHDVDDALPLPAQ